MVLSGEPNGSMFHLGPVADHSQFKCDTVVELNVQFNKKFTIFLLSCVLWVRRSFKLELAPDSKLRNFVGRPAVCGKVNF